MVICLELGANDLHMIQLMPLPFDCFIKIQSGLTVLVPAYAGCPGKEAAKCLFVCQFRLALLSLMFSKVDPGGWVLILG